MDLDKIRSYAIRKKGVTESLPFDEDTPVYKVMGKIFLLSNLKPPVSINIKCDPELAVEFREKYDSVIPGYHMNKLHWNTVLLDGSIPDKDIYEWIDLSYELIVKGLPKKEKDILSKL